jgi:DNA primase
LISEIQVVVIGTIPSSTIDFARSVSVADIIDAHGIDLRRVGYHESAGSCPICGGTDRFAINNRKNVWNCRGCGIGGDAIALERFLTGHDFRAAVAALADGKSGDFVSTEYQTRPSKSDRDAEAEAYARQQREKARYLHALSKPAHRSIVASYLKTRGITVVPPAIRALTKISDCVSMLVAYGEIGSPITAVHLTRLRADGAGKAGIDPNKISIGSPAGRPLIIAPFNDTRRLVITEGIEDALSVHQSLGVAAWAAGSAAYMPSLADKVPSGIEVTLYPDNDDAGLRAADALAEGLIARGISVFFVRTM